MPAPDAPLVGHLLASRGRRIAAPLRGGITGPGVAGEDGGMAVEAVIGLVGADRGDRRGGAGEQALAFAPVGGFAHGQGVSVQRAGPVSTARCSLRQTRRLSLPWTRTFHSPSP